MTDANDPIIPLREDNRSSLLSSSSGHEEDDEHEVDKRGLLFLSTFSTSVVALELYDANLDVKVDTLTNGMVINSIDPWFSVNAIVDGKGARTVCFQCTDKDGTTSTHMEN